MTPEQRERMMADTAGSIPQDYLGDMNEKTLLELQELLIRQQKLLKNVKFVEKLPDKGQKIRNMAARLESVIQNRKDVDATTDLFEKMALDAAEARRVPPLHDDSEINVLKMMADRSENKVYVDERTELHETKTSKFVNSYDRVICQAEKRAQKTTAAPKFFPHRSVKHKDIHELSLESLERLKLGEEQKETATEADGPAIKTHTELAKDTNRQASGDHDKQKENSAGLPMPYADELKTKIDSMNSDQKENTAKSNEAKTVIGKNKPMYDETLIASNRWHSPDHGPAKMISIEESVTVLEHQKAKQEALKAQQAAEKLAQRLHINMTAFDPEGSRNMVYRNPGNVESEDEDSDDVEEDYPE